MLTPNIMTGILIGAVLRTLCWNRAVGEIPCLHMVFFLGGGRSRGPNFFDTFDASEILRDPNHGLEINDGIYKLHMNQLREFDLIHPRSLISRTIFACKEFKAWGGVSFRGPEGMSDWLVVKQKEQKAPKKIDMEGPFRWRFGSDDFPDFFEKAKRWVFRFQPLIFQSVPTQGRKQQKLLLGKQITTHLAGWRYPTWVYLGPYHGF